jgi:D-alanine transaminase
MEILANWNGQQMPLSQVQVSVLDRAFMFGDSVYEVIRVYGGRLWNYQEHVDRLAASLQSLNIDFDVAPIVGRLHELIAASTVNEALAYVQVTRGCAPRHHHYPAQSRPNCLLYVESFADPFAGVRATGARAITFPDIRWARNDIKATSMAANCIAADAARSRGCLEAILVKDGFVTEGSHTSVFAVKGETLIVSPSGNAVLPGITKQQVISLCRSAGVAMQEGRIKVEELSGLTELFITATPEEIIGIIEVDGACIADGKPGKITHKLQTSFRQAVDAWLKVGVS